MKMMQNRSAFLLVMLMLTGLFCACDGADEVVTAKQSRVEISAKVALLYSEYRDQPEIGEIPWQQI